MQSKGGVRFNGRGVIEHINSVSYGRNRVGEGNGLAGDRIISRKDSGCRFSEDDGAMLLGDGNGGDEVIIHFRVNKCFRVKHTRREGQGQLC